jgi:tRNA 5-methylaminomethyl-2-thiouridine biosynthesis bifunctional protein
VLTLVYGEALELLQESTFQADCWYLDGFSPDKNQELWTQAIAHQIFRLTREGGTFSTYSAASQVRKNFQQAGFKVIKQQGFRNKREMLTGLCETRTQKEEFNYQEKCWFNLSENSTSGRHTTVIGAGLAGVCIAAALAKRNWKVTLIDKHAQSAMEGSGNKNAILMPRLSIDHDAQSQITLSGFLYSLNFFNHLKQMAPDLAWEQCGAVQIPRDEKQCQRMKQLLDQQDIPDDLLHPVTNNQINALSGCSPANDGWYIPLAGWTVPEEICDTLLNLYKDNIQFIADTEISSIHEAGDFWTVLDHHKKEISRSNRLVIANANCADQFNQTQWCKTFAKRGQVTYLPKTSSNIHPQKIICADAYITPEIDSHYVLGASFITADTSKEIRQSEHLENLARIRHMIPDFEFASPDDIDGRAAIRAVSPDRLPIVGPVARADKFYSQYTEAALGATHIKYHNPDYYNGLYLATGFGSRGLAWIPLCAEVIACMIDSEPMPLAKSLINSLHPSRYLMNNLVKQVS